MTVLETSRVFPHRLTSQGAGQRVTPLPAAEPEIFLPCDRSTDTRICQVYGWAVPYASSGCMTDAHWSHRREKTQSLWQPEQQGMGHGLAGQFPVQVKCGQAYRLHIIQTSTKQKMQTLFGETPLKRKKKVWKGSIPNGMMLVAE